MFVRYFLRGADIPPRPSGTPGPDPTAADAFVAATASCRGFRSIEGELALSGRAGEERVRGRVLTGLEAGGAVRLEAPAPFGAPFFILAGRSEVATLILPRERRVLANTPVSAVLERLTGLSLGADDLRLILSGCLVEKPAPADGRQWPGGWQAVTIGPERVAYIRTVQGRPVLVAADYGPWHVDYSQHANGFPACACASAGSRHRRIVRSHRHHRARRAARGEYPDQSAGMEG